MNGQRIVEVLRHTCHILIEIFMVVGYVLMIPTVILLVLMVILGSHWIAYLTMVLFTVSVGCTVIGFVLYVLTEG